MMSSIWLAALCASCPRDARANRELLDQCDVKMREVKNLLNNKTHISKITLRKAALLFQILENLLPPHDALVRGHRELQPRR